jgi:hypothetical protein
MDIVLIFVSVLVWSILRSEHGIHYLLWAYNGSTANTLLTQIITLVVVKSNGISIGDGFPLPVLPAYLRRASLGPDPGICQSLLQPPCCLGAVLCKQWFCFYKFERFGRGCLEERGQNTRKKLKASRHGSSMLYCNYSLPCYESHYCFWAFPCLPTSGGHNYIVITTAALGSLFYTFTLFASLFSLSYASVLHP